MSRFCSNCGKDIGDAPFCSNCGTKSGSSKGMSISKPNINLSSFGSIGYYWFMAIVSVVLSVMTLFNWFTVSIPSIATTKLNCFSFVFKVYNIAETFDILEDFGLVIFFGIILLLLAALVALFAITACRRALVESSEAILYSKLASGVSAALSVVTIGIVSFAKNALESEMGIIGSMAGDMMSLSSHPYIMLVISVVGIFVGRGTEQTKEEPLRNYAYVLKNMKAPQQYKFNVLHISGSKTPELIIFDKENTERIRVKIYKSCNGQVVSLKKYNNDTNKYEDLFGYVGMIGYNEKENLIYHKEISEKYTKDIVYSVGSNNACFVDAIGEVDNLKQLYSINGIDIDRVAYYGLFDGFTMISEDDGYEINDDNIEDVLGV